MSLQEINDRSIAFAVLTVSDTRDKSTDKGGKLVRELLTSNGYVCCDYAIVPDDVDRIQTTVKQWCQNYSIDVIVTTGGTGLAKRDVTLEAVAPLFTKHIPGFGELFRQLSYQEDIGTKAMASRAEAGIVDKKIVFSIPGSVGAVRLGMNKLILPEVRHLVYEVLK